jgi:hypothetical protein
LHEILNHYVNLSALLFDRAGQWILRYPLPRSFYPFNLCQSLPDEAVQDRGVIPLFLGMAAVELLQIIARGLPCGGSYAAALSSSLS